MVYNNIIIISYLMSKFIWFDLIRLDWIVCVCVALSRDD